MIRVLIAEDDSDLRSVLKLRLEHAGFQVETVCNGQEALDRIGDSPPDIVLLDILMPVKDGFKVVQHLRSEPETEKLPVILVSGSLDTLHELRKNIPHIVVQGYLTKPFDFQKLVATIHQVVGR